MNKHLMLTLPNATDEHVSSLITFVRGVSEWDLSLTDLDADFSDPDEKCSPEAEAADRKERTPFLVGWPDTPATPTSSERELADKEALDSHRQAQRVYELTVSRDALAARLVESQAATESLQTENKELDGRVGELVAELTNEQNTNERLSRRVLELESANVALRANTLMTEVKIPAIGETVEEVTEEAVKALPVGARFKDRDGDVTQKSDKHGMSYGDSGSTYSRITRNFGPFTRIDNAPDQAATDD